MEAVREEFGICREECLQANKTKLDKRYKEKKFSNQQAHDRADKEIQRKKY